MAGKRTKSYARVQNTRTASTTRSCCGQSVIGPSTLLPSDVSLRTPMQTKNDHLRAGTLQLRSVLFTECCGHP